MYYQCTLDGKKNVVFIRSDSEIPGKYLRKLSNVEVVVVTKKKAVVRHLFAAQGASGADTGEIY